jgi:hypothetical protein
MSRFVLAGSLDKPTKRGDEWLKAQQEIDESRKRKEAEGRQDGGKSLYEVLQANKGVSWPAMKAVALDVFEHTANHVDCFL